MDRSKLKSYAPKARRDFIRAMTDRAAIYGLTEKKIEPVTEKGDVAIIAGKAYPISVAVKRRSLENRIKRHGFEQTMEALAYTWFNRFAAIRFMELHGYLDHGYRVLSHPEGKTAPEIVDHAEHVDMPGLNKNKVIELKLDGTKEAELYRILLIAQCNALHSAMPFLFEQIDDETELLLPDNLLHSDSLIRQLVNEIDEADWQPVEIIGWLYQFYISEKKDEVIGKVVKSEDIPAATQLFTPNWIAKYLVQNSLGRQWLATYPNSPLRQQMEYYIEPAEQTPEIQVQLKVITPTELNPEELTLMDPACGSGHILVEGYDIFKAIYQERGYRAKDIPRLILENNLFGIEIDDRAEQLAAFALMMKARADDRRIFSSAVRLNILSIQHTTGLNGQSITDEINAPLRHSQVHSNIAPQDVSSLVRLFKDGKPLGSLISVPANTAVSTQIIRDRIKDILKQGDLVAQAALRDFVAIVEQGCILGRRYDAVVANPPYMGGRWMNPLVKGFAKDHYPDSYLDLFAVFIERGLELTKRNGHLAMVTMQSWMFLSSFQKMRERLLATATIETMAHLGPRAFSSISGEVVTVAAFACRNGYLDKYRPTFFRLIEGEEEEKAQALLHRRNCYTKVTQHDFQKIPGSPLAYWAGSQVRDAFEHGIPLRDVADPKVGLQTGSNDRFVRIWYEVSIGSIGLGIKDRTEARLSGKKWFPYNKGGEYRKWFGNCEHVVNWANDGHDIRTFVDSAGKVRSRPQNIDSYFKPSLTWSFVSSSSFAVRRSDEGFVFDVGGSSAFPNATLLNTVAGFLCSRVAFTFMQILNPTLNFQVGNVASLPLRLDRLADDLLSIDRLVEEAVAISRDDWNTCETAWQFQTNPLVTQAYQRSTVQESIEHWVAQCRQRIQRLIELERENNRIFIRAYGLQDELAPEVFEDQITLYHPDREEDIKRLVSYAIGCMMGRYSLDKPGLIYAHSGNKDFDPSNYKTFAADQDGIIPLTDTAWFDDDAANRVIEAIGVAWPKERLEENLKFIAEILGSNKGEQPRETIRRYLATDFFKHHLSMYKKRPIYWLFSSGKQRAFQCLVYLHRYNEGTLSRMRTEYVIPLQGKISARIAQLAGDIAVATSTAFRSKLTKERDKLVKQHAELQAFDEKLRHYADLRISIDLDDGVKDNYGKFGDLLAEVKAITGGASDE
jgi:type II restriction/modification system DNA methylase subunit YeeA